MRKIPWFDVALLILIEDVSISLRVMPICISNKILNSNLTNQVAEVGGYGQPRNQSDGTNYHLNSLAMTIIDHKDCQITMKQYCHKDEISEHSICAIPNEKNTGASKGDSGGN